MNSLSESEMSFLNSKVGEVMTDKFYSKMPKSKVIYMLEEIENGWIVIILNSVKKKMFAPDLDAVIKIIGG